MYTVIMHIMHKGKLEISSAVFCSVSFLLLFFWMKLGPWWQSAFTLFEVQVVKDHEPVSLKIKKLSRDTKWWAKNTEQTAIDLNPDLFLIFDWTYFPLCY